MQLNPYLTFDGQCEEAFTFYHRCLGGTIEGMQTHGDSPMAEHVPADWHKMILHARLVVGDAVLMGSDRPPGSTEAHAGFSVSVGVDDPAEADRVFQALAEGGRVTMPIDETFWATRFGMLVDRFGVPWMVNCNRPA